MKPDTKNKNQIKSNQSSQSAVQVSKHKLQKNYSEEIISKKDSFVQIHSAKESSKTNKDGLNKTAASGIKKGAKS